jgi:MoxR-like ATPase
MINEISNVQPLVAKAQAIREDLRKRFRQRDALSEIAVSGLISGHFAATFSPPGEGKTAFWEAFAKYIRDGKHFSVGVSKSTTDSDLFGGPDVPLLVQTGKYQRSTDGFIPTATTVFVDEGTKGEGALLQTLLRVMNELEYEGKPIPLLHLAMAGNELIPELRGATGGIPNDLGPLEESLLAFWDRFLYKLEVDCLDPGSDDWRAVVFDGVARKPDPSVGISRSEVLALRDAVKYVTIPPAIMESLYALAEALPQGIEAVEESEVRVSTRTWTKAIEALKAHALLAGRDSVTLLDLDWLKYMFWITPDQIKHIVSQISKVKSAKMGEADATMARLEEYYKALLVGKLASVSESESESGLKVESSPLSPSDNRAVTAPAKLLEYVKVQVMALEDSLSDADGDDALVVGAALAKAKQMNTNLVANIARLTKQQSRVSRR